MRPTWTKLQKMTSSVISVKCMKYTCIYEIPRGSCNPREKRGYLYTDYIRVGLSNKGPVGPASENRGYKLKTELIGDLNVY